MGFLDFLFGKSQPVQEITGQELVRDIQKGEKIQLVDVRGSGEYAQGHVPGSKLIPLTSINSHVGELDKGVRVVTICASGHRSSLAAKTLMKHGFTNVQNLAGGMMRWPGKVER